MKGLVSKVYDGVARLGEGAKRATRTVALGTALAVGGSGLSLSTTGCGSATGGDVLHPGNNPPTVGFIPEAEGTGYNVAMGVEGAVENPEQFDVNGGEVYGRIVLWGHPQNADPHGTKRIGKIKNLYNTHQISYEAEGMDGSDAGALIQDAIQNNKPVNVLALYLAGGLPTVDGHGIRTGGLVKLLGVSPMKQDPLSHENPEDYKPLEDMKYLPGEGP